MYIYTHTHIHTDRYTCIQGTTKNVCLNTGYSEKYTHNHDMCYWNAYWNACT